MLRAYAQLLRLPNVFTAWADVLMGWMIGIVSPQAFVNLQFGIAWPWLYPLACLLGVSTFLYCAGMVWNDFFDAEEDRRDRPHRPIPSGRISRQEAAGFGSALILLGLGLAATCLVTGWGSLHTLGIAAALAALILGYDAWLKRTIIGPFAMGGCRFLNVLLGFTAGFEVVTESFPVHVAAVVGLYIVGVTWFARKEATRSGRGQLIAAAGVMLAAATLGAMIPLHWWPEEGPYDWIARLLLAIFVCILSQPVLVAIRRPEPALVQRAVKSCILGLIGLDACLAFMVVGWPGLMILLLLPPALILGKWVYST